MRKRLAAGHTIPDFDEIYPAIRLDIRWAISDACGVTQEDLEDALDDLAHDLGKYIHLPLSLLPDTASDDEFLEAATLALIRTRRAPTGDQSARELWVAFCQEVGNELVSYPGWIELEQTIANALDWTERLQDAARSESRTKLVADLRAVAPAIRVLRGQIDG